MSLGFSLGIACCLRYPICDFFPLLHIPIVDSLDLQHMGSQLMVLHRVSVQCTAQAAGSAKEGAEYISPRLIAQSLVDLFSKEVF